MQSERLTGALEEMCCPPLLSPGTGMAPGLRGACLPRGSEAVLRRKVLYSPELSVTVPSAQTVCLAVSPCNRSHRSPDISWLVFPCSWCTFCCTGSPFLGMNHKKYSLVNVWVPCDLMHILLSSERFSILPDITHPCAK